jgi:enoyl-CoA hydratase/carnithine racemase
MALRWELDGGVALVTIDHPPTNLVDGELIGDLLRLLAEVEPDPAVRVLLLRSADPDFFLMHGDVELLQDVAPPYAGEVTEPNVAAATFDRLSSGRLVTIGVLDGFARGGGCELLCALDLRLGSSRAVVGQPEVAMGILPGAGGTARWPRLVGRGRALEIVLSGRDVGAEELLRIGWLDRLCEDVEAEGLALARRIASMPPESVAAVKRVVDSPTPLVTESDELARLMATGGHQDRMRRFLAAGGQTREGETSHMASLLDAMLDP